MTSIRIRLFFQMVIIILMTLLILWVANAFFLEDYYLKQQKEILLDYYASLNSLSTDALPNAKELFIDIESQSNVTLIILDDQDGLVYTSEPRYQTEDDIIPFDPSDTIPIHPSQPSNDSDTTPTGIEQTPPDKPSDFSPELERLDYPNEEAISDSLSYTTGRDPFTRRETLALIGTLNNGYYINMRLPLASLDAPIAIVNRFLALTGLLVLVVSLMLTYYFSNHFTRPIKEISRITGRMKRLDFSESAVVNARDELGALAENVNEMSTVLSKNIDALNISNRQLRDEIKAKDRLDVKRRQLLNNVSHELKTPLALMEGYAEALQLGIHKDPKRTDFYCDVIIDETTKMNQLVQTLLDIDQVTFGDTLSQPITMDLISYLNSTILKYDHVLNESKIELKTVMPSKLFIHTDPLRLDQVFTNYLTNAIHYVIYPRTISIKVIQEKKKAIIEVFNTSQLLSEDDREKIWDSFYKIDKARTREKGGHGLGLSIVQAILEADGLSYGVRNESNGVTFWFEQSYASEPSI